MKKVKRTGGFCRNALKNCDFSV